MPKKREPLRIDGTVWIAVPDAARLCRIPIASIAEKAASGAFRSIEREDLLWIPEPVVNRLKRESSVVISARAANKRDLKPVLKETSQPRMGPHAAREVQDVLPMSSGRGGTGWAGQKPRS